MLTSQNIQTTEEKSLEQILDIVPNTYNVSNKKEIVVSDYIDGTANTEEEKDFQEVRSNLKKLIVKSDTAIDNLLTLAENLESPARAYEVAADLIKTSLEVNSKLAEIHRLKKPKVVNNEKTETNTTNNMFVGSTSDLLDLIKNQLNSPQK